MDTGKRTILKSTIWIFMGWVTMSLVGFLFTGSVAAGGWMATLNSAIGFALYVIYERVWARIDWGRAHGQN